MGGMGGVGGVGPKNYAKDKKFGMGIKQYSLRSVPYCKCSLHLFVPNNDLFVFLMFISYSNMCGPKSIFRP